MDNIIFEGNETEISAIGYFYRNGVVDLKVVYIYNESVVGSMFEKNGAF